MCKAYPPPMLILHFLNRNFMKTLQPNGTNIYHLLKF